MNSEKPGGDIVLHLSDIERKLVEGRIAPRKFPIVFSEAVWRQRLGDFRYSVLRERATERAGTGALYQENARGTYYSAATGQPLFRSDAKFDSGSGWPSFYEAVDPEAVWYRVDSSHGMTRIEVVDSLSGSHLGHVFPDGPAPTGLRFCINSASLVFVHDGDEPPEIASTS